MDVEGCLRRWKLCIVKLWRVLLVVCGGIWGFVVWIGGVEMVRLVG